MAKNHRIEARVDETTKKALEKKAETFGGMTKFLEEISKKDIILLDEAVAKLLQKLYGNSAVRGI